MSLKFRAKIGLMHVKSYICVLPVHLQSQKKLILLSLCSSIFLMLIKFGAFFLTSSNAVLTDAAESIVNVIAGAFAFYSIYLSAIPRDLNHPYGHGKVEYFSMFVEGVLILLAGLIIISKSVYNIFFPIVIQEILQGAALIGLTGVINFLFGWYLVKKGRGMRSVTLYAEGKHLLSDAWSSLGIVAGLALIYLTGNYVLDSVLSVTVGLYISYTGYKLLRKSVAALMDESDIQQVESVIHILDTHRHDAWIDVHNLRTQQYGHELHIDCHVTLPYYYDLNHVHEEISQIDTLMNQKGDVRTEFFIHADPCLPECCHYCRMKDCPVRSEEKRVDIEWTAERLMMNKKHFS
jgi:cation diffusion facilitator family transporter